MPEPITEILPSKSDNFENYIEMLSTPIAWIPEFANSLLGFFLEQSGWIAGFMYLLLLFPAILLLGGICCTQASLYTLPFRAGRVDFVKIMLMAWWDAMLALWLYWVGLGRFVMVIVGWMFTLSRLAIQMLVEIFRQLIIRPFSKTGQMTESYFQPGVPWLAFLMMLFWGFLESTIFTYTLFPTVTEVLSGIVGKEAPALTGTFLFLFLSFLILGSFACLQAFVEAMQQKDYKFLVQIILIEIFVMTFEVMFLYRELVDAIIPWVAQYSEFRPGIGFTLSLATFGWIGIRGMTWFLFGQYGTPPLLAFISRRPMVHPESTSLPVPMTAMATEPWWQAPLREFKGETEWLHLKANELLEYVTLPFIHVLAAFLNFAMILVTGRPVFSIPFKSLQEALHMREHLPLAKLQPGKAGV